MFGKSMDRDNYIRDKIKCLWQTQNKSKLLTEWRRKSTVKHIFNRANHLIRNLLIFYLLHIAILFIYISYIC